MNGDSAIRVKCTWSNTGNTIQALSMDEDDTADFTVDSMDEDDHYVVCTASLSRQQAML